jgi:hypothetical protein
VRSGCPLPLRRGQVLQPRPDGVPREVRLHPHNPQGGQGNCQLLVKFGCLCLLEVGCGDSLVAEDFPQEFQETGILH